MPFSKFILEESKLSEVLQKIFHKTQEETQARQARISIQALEAMEYFARECIGLEHFRDRSQAHIIAEYKKASPAKGAINQSAPISISADYAKHGASAISVLTNGSFFSGSLDDLAVSRALHQKALLRKDFIYCEYQILEAKAYGADIILLIAEMLDKPEIKALSKFAQSLGLGVLLELHSAEELPKIVDSIDLLGVNNRNLKTLKVDVETSFELIKQLPVKEFPLISESGLQDAETIKRLYQHGYSGFLIGEYFMKQKNPGDALGDLVRDLAY